MTYFIQYVIAMQNYKYAAARLLSKAIKSTRQYPSLLPHSLVPSHQPFLIYQAFFLSLVECNFRNCVSGRILSPAGIQRGTKC